MAVAQGNLKLEDENGRGKVKEAFGWVRKKEKDEDTGLLV